MAGERQFTIDLKSDPKTKEPVAEDLSSLTVDSFFARQ